MLEKWSRTTFIFFLLSAIGLVFVLGSMDSRWYWRGCKKDCVNGHSGVHRDPTH